MKTVSKWRQLQNEDNLKNEDDLQNENNLKNENDLKNEDNLKNENDFKNKDDLKKIIRPPHFWEYYLNFFLMTSHLNSHRTTDIKPEMLSGVQTGNGYNIIYAAMPMREQTEKTTFSCKDD